MSMTRKPPSGLLSRYGFRGQIGAAVSGYLLLAVSAIFLLHVAYQAIHLQVFDEVVVAVIGALALNCLLAAGLIAAFARPAGRDQYGTNSISERWPIAADRNGSEQPIPFSSVS